MPPVTIRLLLFLALCCGPAGCSRLRLAPGELEKRNASPAGPSARWRCTCPAGFASCP